MTARHVLVAGIGNIFFGDDAFGVEVVARLLRRHWPADVVVRDFGIRGIDLTYALERCAAAVLVDAADRGAAPGTLFVIDPRVDDADTGRAGAAVEPHALTPDRAMSLARSAAPSIPVRLVACQPESLGEPGMGRMGLSDCVAGAVESAADLVIDVVEGLRKEVRDA